MASIPVVINTLDDLEICASALFRHDDRFKMLHERNGLPPLRRRAGGLEGLAEIVVGQLISIKAADTIWARVKQSIDRFCPGDVAAMDIDELAGLGLTRAKAATIINAAKLEHGGGFSFASLETMDDSAAAAALMQLKGVGRWTADIYVLSCLGRSDVWPAGDLAVRAGLQSFEGLQDLPAIADMDMLANRWRPLRAVAARYLWDHYGIQRNEKVRSRLPDRQTR
jgi:DNA-3-methyladenine glycosylase II